MVGKNLPRARHVAGGDARRDSRKSGNRRVEAVREEIEFGEERTLRGWIRSAQHDARYGFRWGLADRDLQFVARLGPYCLHRHDHLEGRGARLAEVLAVHLHREHAPIRAFKGKLQGHDHAPVRAAEVHNVAVDARVWLDRWQERQPSPFGGLAFGPCFCGRCGLRAYDYRQQQYNRQYTVHGVPFRYAASIADFSFRCKEST